MLAFRKKMKEMLAERGNLMFPPDYEEKFIVFLPEQWINKTKEIIAVFDELIKQVSKQ